jgi:hypothetical protein
MKRKMEARGFSITDDPKAVVQRGDLIFRTYASLKNLREVYEAGIDGWVSRNNLFRYGQQGFKIVYVTKAYGWPGFTLGQVANSLLMAGFRFKGTGGLHLARKTWEYMPHPICSKQLPLP